MTDELYTESFFKTAQIAVNKEKAPLILKEITPEAPPEKQPPEKQLVELYETTNQMNYYLDQLEKELMKECENVADFQFIFSKIRAKLAQKNTDGIFEQLAELEELLDLS